MSAFIVTWNDENHAYYPRILQMIQLIKRKRRVIEPWRFLHSAIANPGDQIWLLKQGSKPRGIFGRGRVLERKLVPISSGSRSGRQGLNIELDLLVDPKEEYLVEEADVRRIHDRTVRASGWHIPDEESHHFDTIVSARNTNEIAKDLLDVKLDRNLSATTKKRLTDAKLGQGRYRKQAMALWNRKCALSGCSVSEILQASHIKPWRASSTRERLDPNNSLLLTANLHALFDSNLISFDIRGSLRVSTRIDRSQSRLLNLNGKLRKTLNPSQMRYLAYRLRNSTRSS